MGTRAEREEYWIARLTALPAMYEPSDEPEKVIIAAMRLLLREVGITEASLLFREKNRLLWILELRSRSFDGVIVGSAPTMLSAAGELLAKAEARGA